MFKNISLGKESIFEIDHSNQTQLNQTETLDWFIIINDLVWYLLKPINLVWFTHFQPY